MIKKIEWNGIDAVEITEGGYEALIVPSVGANLVKLYHVATGVDVLRTPKPDEMETFVARPQVFGLPLLFPPNRIEDGTYTFNGKRYQFPITIPAQNNYHHGIIKSQPLTVTHTEIGEGYSLVEATFFSNMVNDAIFCDFAHEFECKMSFRLSTQGMEHTVSFKNLSDSAMPLGVGYHTPINVPFCKGSSSADYLIRLSAGERWELTDRTLPTGRLLPLEGDLALVRDKGIRPTGEAMEFVVTAKPIMVDGQPYHGAVICDTLSGRRVFYEVDNNVKHWTFWNNGGTVEWACPEPQTWAINAPNLNMPADVTGLQSVEPLQTWSMTSKLYVK